MSRTVRVLLVLLLSLTGAAVAVPASAATACSTAWGSVPEERAGLDPGPLVAVRAGRLACWDRLVVEVEGPASGYSVRYVDVVTQDGSGNPVNVPGGARLQVVVHHPAWNTFAVPDVRGFATLRSVVPASSFEGYTTIGVGTRARLPFRVLTLAGPGTHSRVVLDVAHRW